MDTAAWLQALRTPGRQRGRVVDLRGVSEPVYLVGDVHAKTERIPALLQLLDLEEALASRQAYLVFLGDLFHREERERIGEMDSSVAMLQAVLELKARYPTQVFWLLGNHEFTRTERCKYGCFQGILFRIELQRRRLDEFYDTFVAAGALALLHDRCVAVHAGPALSLNSLAELEQLPVGDFPTPELHRGVLELTCGRHRLWSSREKLGYSDADVERFLELCGCAEGLLVTGHTPLNRECDWHWQFGPRTHVIFAAGRELGCAVVRPQGVEFRRLARSQAADDHVLQPCETSEEREIGESQTLLPHVTYRFGAAASPIAFGPADSDERVTFRQHRELPPALQEFYGSGFYLMTEQRHPQVRRLPRYDAFVLGPHGEPLRAEWLQQEVAVVGQQDWGEFQIRALVPGLALDFA